MCQPCEAARCHALRRGDTHTHTHVHARAHAHARTTHTHARAPSPQGPYRAAFEKLFGLLEDSGWALLGEDEDASDLPDPDALLPSLGYGGAP